MISIDAGTTVIVTVNEPQLNIHNSRVLLELLKEVLKEHGRSIQMDMANVTFLDSTAIAMFVEFNNLLKDARLEFSFTNLTPFVKKVFDMLHLTKFFIIA